jgi:ribosome-binding factor A
MDPIARARVNAQIQEILAELLAQARDPRVEGVTITGVQVTQDLSFAKVFFSSLDDAANRKVTRQGLESVSGWLRREIGKRAHLRSVPQLTFEFDASLEKGQRIETLLREWHEEGAGGPPSAPSDDPEDTHA